MGAGVAAVGTLRVHGRAEAREPLGKAKVGELERAAVARDEDVGRLDVAVQDDWGEAVEVLKGLQDVQ